MNKHSNAGFRSSTERIVAKLEKRLATVIEQRDTLRDKLKNTRRKVWTQEGAGAGRIVYRNRIEFRDIGTGRAKATALRASWAERLEETKSRARRETGQFHTYGSLMARAAETQRCMDELDAAFGNKETE
jgi:hypothetical protein